MIFFYFVQPKSGKREQAVHQSDWPLPEAGRGAADNPKPANRHEAMRSAKMLKRQGALEKGDVLIHAEGWAYQLTRVETRNSENGEGHGELSARLLPLTIHSQELRTKSALTSREIQVTWLLVARATNAEIAHALGVAAHTARNHTRRVLEKLQVTSKCAVRYCLLEMLNSPRNWCDEDDS